MKKYTFEVVIEEGCCEFWEDLAGKTGCDEVLDLLDHTLSCVGFYNGDNCSIKLKKYEE